MINQVLSFAIIALMMAAFVWGRFRYDLVACVALLAAVATGVVPYDAAFSGFSNDIVIIVGSALLVSAGVARSGIMEFAVQRYAPNVTGVRAQLILLVAVVTVLSAFVKNIGALAIMIPIAFQFARRSNTSPSVFLMPMASGSLIGGLMTQIGTSPNVVVSRDARGDHRNRLHHVRLHAGRRRFVGCRHRLFSAVLLAGADPHPRRRFDPRSARRPQLCRGGAGRRRIRS